MVRIVLKSVGSVLLTIACVALLSAQQPGPAPTSETGQISVNGHSTPYLIHRLPVSSFPQLPAAVQSLLNQRGCMIPQTYDAHQPENVMHASLERRGASDWAVLCSEHGTVSLLVFFADSAKPAVLASAPETERLGVPSAGSQAGTLGFDWAIDAASPQQVHDAQAAMKRRPPLLDHDALADSRIDRKTVYHYYSAGAWTVVPAED